MKFQGWVDKYGIKYQPFDYGMYLFIKIDSPYPFVGTEDLTCVIGPYIGSCDIKTKELNFNSTLCAPSQSASDWRSNKDSI